MLRLIGLGVVVVAVCAAGIWGMWTYALERPDMQLQLFRKAARNSHLVANPPPAAAADFRATACAIGPCVLVEAGGLAFLVGAGEGVASQLASSGLLRPDLDAVLLTDLSVASIGGLPELRNLTSRRGRRAPLTVFGPVGVAGVVDGVNLMLAASDAMDAAVRSPTGATTSAALLAAGLAVQQEEGRPAPLGAIVFDSGVVTVLSFQVASPAGAADRLYRFDFADRSLLVGGCSVRSADLVAAVRGAKQAAAILPASSPALLDIQRHAAGSTGSDRPASFIGAPAGNCLSPDEVASAFLDARLTGGLLSPLYPAPVDVPTMRAWREIVTSPAGLDLAVGIPGARLDLVPQGSDNTAASPAGDSR